MAPMRCPLAVCVVVASLAPVGPAWALDHVSLRHKNKQVQVAGRVLVAAQDGGLLLLARDGVLWTVQPDELLEHTTDDVPFKPLSADEVSERLLSELPPGFDVHRTAHYLIFYNTSREYAS